MSNGDQGNIEHFPGQPSEAPAGLVLDLSCCAFRAVGREVRRSLQHERLGRLECGELHYSGPTLHQTHLDLWESLRYLRRRLKRPGPALELPIRPLLLFLGAGGEAGFELGRVRARLQDMREARLRLESPDGSVRFGLVADYTLAPREGRLRIRLDPGIPPELLRRPYSDDEMETRLGLHGELCRWLHAFWLANPTTPAISATSLHALCRSDLANLSRFAADLLEAVAQLENMEFLQPGSELDSEGLLRVSRTKADVLRFPHG